MAGGFNWHLLSVPYDLWPQLSGQLLTIFFFRESMLRSEKNKKFIYKICIFLILDSRYFSFSCGMARRRNINKLLLLFNNEKFSRVRRGKLNIFVSFLMLFFFFRNEPTSYVNEFSWMNIFTRLDCVLESDRRCSLGK